MLLTFDNGVVAAPVKEDAGRRLGTAVHLVSLTVIGIQETLEGFTNNQAGNEMGREGRGRLGWGSGGAIAT